MPRRIGVVLLALCLAIVALALLGTIEEARAGGECRLGSGGEDYPVTPNSPTGIVGCEAYGVGTASTWGGPGVARNDCRWPWDACKPLRITILETGASIEIRPSMFCDCYLGGPGPLGEGPRLVDIGADLWPALGIPGPGLYDVRVELVDSLLPNTAMSVARHVKAWLGTSGRGTAGVVRSSRNPSVSDRVTAI